MLVFNPDFQVIILNVARHSIPCTAMYLMSRTAICKHRDLQAMWLVFENNNKIWIRFISKCENEHIRQYEL